MRSFITVLVVATFVCGSFALKRDFSNEFLRQEEKNSTTNYTIE